MIFESKDCQCSTYRARSCHCAPLAGGWAFAEPEATQAREEPEATNYQGSNSCKQDMN